MVLKVPRLNSSPLALCDRPFSLLGFGDILVPGMQIKCFMMTQFTCFENKSKGLSNSKSVTDERFSSKNLKQILKLEVCLRKLCETAVSRSLCSECLFGFLFSGLLVVYCHRFDILTQSYRIYFMACTVGTYVGWRRGWRWAVLCEMLML